MTRCLNHRGPDSDGIFTDRNFGIALGHKRLSIIDLSAKSAQPYHSRDGTYVMVYNGEIYNYKELAHKYKLDRDTEGDTEVLIELYSLLGPDVFEQISGMFALAIFNKRTGEICLARDARGIKPLYYHCSNNNLVFGSEMRAIIESGIELNIAINDLKNYFNLGFFPRSSTVYREVRKLEPGQYLNWNGENIEIKTYTSSPDLSKTYNASNLQEAKGKLERLLHNAVKSRLIGDRPVGTFLSGGIDSSLISYFANLDRTTPVNSYNVKIENAGFDESQYAERIAGIFGTNHHVIEIRESTIKDDLVNIIDRIDEPFGDSSFIPTYVLSEYVKKHITVALSGDGGDELFMGYGYYKWPERLAKFPFSIKGFWKNFFKYYKISKNKDHSKYFRFENAIDLPQHLFSQEQSFFSKTEIQNLFSDGQFKYEIYRQENLMEQMSDSGEIQSYLDFENYLPDDLLVKVDRASMLHSLEVRVPFLDNEVVEFAWQVDPSLKMNRGEGKFLLKELLCDYLPKDLVYRKKWGFSIPLDEWLQNEFGYLIDESLDPEIIDSFGIFNGHYINDLVKEFRNGKVYLYNKIWLLIVFFRWYRNTLKEQIVVD